MGNYDGPVPPLRIRVAYWLTEQACRVFGHAWKRTREDDGYGARLRVCRREYCGETR